MRSEHKVLTAIVLSLALAGCQTVEKKPTETDLSLWQRGLKYIHNKYYPEKRNLEKKQHKYRHSKEETSYKRR